MEASHSKATASSVQRARHFKHIYDDRCAFGEVQDQPLRFRSATYTKGPNGSFINLPPTIETQIDFISDSIDYGEGEVLIGATVEAESEWTEPYKKLSDNSLFKKTNSWIFGANAMPYL